jgi:DNA-binding response OmpR family regulator
VPQTPLPCWPVPDVLIAADGEWVHDEVRQVLRGPDVTVRWVRSGPDAIKAVRERAPDLAVLDLQIGQMGAMAISLELRLEEGMDRLPHVPILILLDRRPDVFLARRSGAEGFVIKPLDPIRLRKAVTALLAGGTYEDESYKPETVPPGPV